MEDENLKRLAEKYHNGLVLKEKQAAALTHIQKRMGDLLVNLPVGYGKSIIYHLLPALLKSDNLPTPVIIVISPLNIIQKDQIKSLLDHGVSACRVNIKTYIEETTDDADVEKQNYGADMDDTVQNIASGKYSILLCHPEAILNTAKGKELLSNERFKENVAAVVIDECHILEKWGEEFRTTFKKLGSLKVFFPNAPFIALSGTLTVTQKKTIPALLKLPTYKIIEENPDKANIYLAKFRKLPCGDVHSEYEKIIFKVCDDLYKEKENFPITLLFIPVFYMSEAVVYLQNKFGYLSIRDSLYSAICSGQDPYIIDYTIQQLKLENSQIRLVFTTSIAGMGFDPSNVEHVIHTCPPRSMAQYLQEVGRAGRRGQHATATLYFNNRDIAKNLPGIQDDIIQFCQNETNCLRNQLLSVFGFQKESMLKGCACCSVCRNNCKCSDCA